MLISNQSTALYMAGTKENYYLRYGFKKFTDATLRYLPLSLVREGEEEEEESGIDIGADGY